MIFHRKPAFYVVFSLLGLLFLHACVGSEKAEQDTSKKPNIVLLYTDELQMDDVGCYGGDFPTPHLDSLAASGMRFEKGYVTASMCTPSRFSVMTGLYPGRCKHPDFLQSNPVDQPYSIAWNLSIMPGQPTLASVLSENGYYTGMAGKWHIGHFPDSVKRPTFDKEADPTAPQVAQKLQSYQEMVVDLVKQEAGFDDAFSVLWGNFDGFPIKALHHHNIPWITHGAMEFLESSKKQEEPFFLYLTPTAIHGPNHYEDLDYDMTLTIEGPMEEVSNYRPDVERLRAGASGMPRSIAHRYVGIQNIDHQLGLIKEKLSEMGELENTIIIFIADHNIEPGKATSYEKGIHVPFIISWPGVTDGTVNQTSLAQNIDILPTLAEIAGGNLKKERFDGRSLVPILKGEKPQVHDYVFGEAGYTRSITNGQYKYICFRYPDGIVTGMKKGELMHAPNYLDTWRQAHSRIAIEYFPHYFDSDQLYDLIEDPYEQDNLFGQPAVADVQENLMTAMKAHVESFEHPYPFSDTTFMQTSAYWQLVEVTRQQGTDDIEWLSRDHGKLVYPPVE